MNYNEALTSAISNVAYYASKLEKLARETRLQELDLSCVSSVDISDSSVDFYFDKDSDREQQREFVFSVSRVFECGELEKRAGWDKSSIRLSGQSKQDGKWIYISGYVPPTCDLVEIEEPISDYEIKQAEQLLASKTRKCMQVVCVEGK